MALGDASQLRLSWPGKEDSPELVTARLELVEPGDAGCELVVGDNLAEIGRAHV